MAQPDTSNSAVWLVLLDCLPPHFPDSSAASAATAATAADNPAWHPCDDLDAQGVCFEQYYSQNPTAHCSVADYLGGAEAFRIFLNRLQAAGKGCHYRTLDAIQPSATTHESGLLVFTASGCDCPETLATALLQIRSLHAQHSEPQHRPALIITSIKGVSRPLPEHFDCPCTESEIRVPLWILANHLQAARIQMLCGSHDLLPTIADLLALPDHPEIPGTLPSQNTTQRPNTPRSLLQLSMLHPESLERILTIHGNCWTGLRTQHYFLVQTPASQLDTADSQNRRLFQKPDDYWNVNNCLSACEEIAEAMLLAVGHSPGIPD